MQDHKLMNSLGHSVNRLIALDVDDQEIIDRLQERAKVQGRADDADIETVKNSIKVYKENTEPVFDYYANFDKSIKIEGIGTIEEVFERICKDLDNL